MICAKCDGYGKHRRNPLAPWAECGDCDGTGTVGDPPQIPDGCAYCGALPCDQVTKPSDIWQPIATAPKRGDVMLYCEETGEQFVAFWGTDPSDGEQQWVFARSREVSFIVRDPTHWAPCLPSPAMLGGAA